MDTLREKLQEKQKDEIDRPTFKEVDQRVGIAAALVVAIVAAGVGFAIYKRQRRITLARRLLHALPDVDELRASLKKPLERVAKAL